VEIQERAAYHHHYKQKDSREVTSQERNTDSASDAYVVSLGEAELESRKVEAYS
jgi:hypothetical protein